MTGNAAYATPPVTMAALGAAKNDFQTKIAAAKAGGPPDTAAKNSSRQALVGLLRQLAIMSKARLTTICRLCSVLVFRTLVPIACPNRWNNLPTSRSRTMERGGFVASVKPVKTRVFTRPD